MEPGDIDKRHPHDNKTTSTTLQDGIFSAALERNMGNRMHKKLCEENRPFVHRMHGKVVVQSNVFH